jgi:hypothetical protein
MTQDRSVVQPEPASCPEDAAKQRREARARRTYRAPEVHALGSLSAIQDGMKGRRYDCCKQLWYRD